MHNPPPYPHTPSHTNTRHPSIVHASILSLRQSWRSLTDLHRPSPISTATTHLSPSPRPPRPVVACIASHRRGPTCALLASLPAPPSLRARGLHFLPPLCTPPPGTEPLPAQTSSPVGFVLLPSPSSRIDLARLQSPTTTTVAATQSPDGRFSGYTIPF